MIFALLKINNRCVLFTATRYIKANTPNEYDGDCNNNGTLYPVENAYLFILALYIRVG